MSMEMVIVVAGALLCMLMLILAFSGPGGGKSTSRRMSSVKLRHSDSADSRVEQQMRKAVAARRPLIFNTSGAMTRIDKLRLRLAQTGKKWQTKQYFQVSGAIALVVAVAAIAKGAPPLLGLFGGMLVGAGLPHIVVGFLINKRVTTFTTNFPDAIELLVRGLKSGLPVSETIGVVAKEIPGPLGEEFKMVTEKIKIGKSMEDALQETAERMGTPEIQFFVITLAIQKETGGNLAETLGNLADVLRKRAQMKLKIKAMSSESKASAYIVGSLPFFVFGMVWMVNPEYLAGFFVEPRLIIAGMIGIGWLSLGAFIMSRMISFEI